MSDSPIEIVAGFCEAWARLDLDALMEYFADDAVYHNIPVDPLVGHDAIRGMIATFTAGVEQLEFRIRNIVADGSIVLTERVDVFSYPHMTVELPVMGTFEIRYGKIAEWRDYFDLNQFMSQVTPPA